jgi:hypothetical protein
VTGLHHSTDDERRRFDEILADDEELAVFYEEYWCTPIPLMTRRSSARSTPRTSVGRSLDPSPFDVDRVGYRAKAQDRIRCPILRLSSELAELSSQFLSLVDGTVVHKADGDWAAGNSSRHALAEVQRCASLQCGIDRVAIDLARFGGHLVA